MPLCVDVATGATTLYEEDLRLPGFIPLTLARVYRSDRTIGGPFGVGWHFNLDITLEQASDRLVFRGALGRDVAFAPVDVGVQATHQESGLVLQHHPDAYIVFLTPLLQQVFPKRVARGSLLRVARIEDRSGNVLQFGYSGEHLVQIVDTVGRQVQLSYSGAQVTGVRVVAGQEGGQVRTFNYRGDDLIGARDALGREARYAYQDHLMVAFTNRFGGVQYAQYDKHRQCTALWNGDGSLVRRFAYDNTRQQTLVQASDGLQTVYLHTEGTQVLARIGPAGRTQAYYYDENKRLSGFVNEDEEVVTMQRFEPEEHSLMLMDGPERVAFLQLNEHGLARQVTVGLFGPFVFGYDEQERLTTLTAPSGGTWTFARDAPGSVTQLISPAGRTVHLARSPNRREWTVSDDQGKRLTETYDAFGRLVERRDALGRVQRRHYDPEGRLLAVIYEGGYRVQFSYDAVGRLAGVTDAEGYQATFKRDAFGRLLSQTTADGETAQFQYDREGRLVTASQAGRAVRFDYDQGRLVRSTAAEASDEADPVVVCEYGPAGEIRTAELASGLVVFFYDADGHVEAVDQAGQQLALSYDEDGLLVEAALPDGPRMVLRRDQRGRLSAVETAPQAVLELGYDVVDRLTRIGQPGGMQVQFRYDLLDRLVEAEVLEEGGRPVRTHRFLAGAEEFVTVALTSSDATGTDEQGAQFDLVLGRHGQALVLPFGALRVPLWGQDAALYRDAAAWTTRLAACCVHGVETVLRERIQPDPEHLFRQWQQRGDLTRLYSAVPTARDIGSWTPLLNAFFLRRTFYDRFYPGWGPLYLPHPGADWPRSPDRVASGLHMTGPLKPSFVPPMPVASNGTQARPLALLNSLT